MIEIIFILAVVAFMAIRIKGADEKKEKLTDIVTEDDQGAEADLPGGTADSYLEKANRLYKAGAFKNAEKMFIEAIKRNPADAKAYKGLAKIYLDQENNEDALASLEKVCQLTPDDDASHNNLGLLYFKKKDYLKAKSSYEKAISLNKNKYHRYINLSLALKELGDLGKAADVLEDSFRIEAKKETLKMIIDIAATMNDEKRKISAYKNLLELEPDNKEAKRELAKAE